MDTQVIQSLRWWEVAAGVVSIPVGLFGLVYTFFLIRKTGLEARKLRLEILEKEATLSAPSLTGSSELLEKLRLQWQQKLFLGVFFFLNLAAVLIFGVKESPLIGPEVLIIVIGAVSNTIMFSGLLLLRVLRLIVWMLAVDEKLVDIVKDVKDALVSAHTGSESVPEDTSKDDHA